MILKIVLLFFSFLLSLSALDHTQKGLFVRVVDTGQGLSCIIKTTDEDGNSVYAFYDAGENGTEVMKNAKKIIPEQSKIKYFFISHTDGDHMSATEKICKTYKIGNFIRTGFKRTDPNLTEWTKNIEAIEREIQFDGAKDINISKMNETIIGKELKFGKAKFTILSGYSTPPANWNIKPSDHSNMRNSISIVAKLEYEGQSILFCGDVLGSDENQNVDDAIAAELFMIKNKGNLSLKSSVIIPAHHGARDGSSYNFIKEVEPDYVIFSAGSGHRHPHDITVKRYIRWKKTQSVDSKEMQILRTDYGDQEEAPNGNAKEWRFGRNDNQPNDKSGDDNIDIFISSEGKIQVEYLNPENKKFFVKGQQL